MEENFFDTQNSAPIEGYDNDTQVSKEQEAVMLPNFFDVAGKQQKQQDVATTAANMFGDIAPISYGNTELMSPTQEVDNLAGMGNLQKAGRSLMAGVGDTIEGIGQAVDYFGTAVPMKLFGVDYFKNPIAESLKEFGQSIAENNEVYKSPEIQDFSWDDLGKMEFWATSAARTIPFTLSLFIPGALGARVGTKAATALAKYSPSLTSKIGKALQSTDKLKNLKALSGATATKAGTNALGATGGFLGSGAVMTAIDGAVISGEVMETSYNEFIEEGYSEEQARQMSANVAHSTFIDNQASFLLESLSYATVVGGVAGQGLRKTLGYGIKSTAKEFGIKAAAIATAAGIEGTSEMFQETYQDWVKKSNTQEEMGKEFMPYMDYFNSPEAKETKGVAFASALLFGGVGQAISNIGERKKLLASEYDIMTAKIDPEAIDLQAGKEEAVRKHILDAAIDGRLGNTEALTSELVSNGILPQVEADYVLKTASEVKGVLENMPLAEQFTPAEKSEIAAAYLHKNSISFQIEDIQSSLQVEFDKIANVPNVTSEEKKAMEQKVIDSNPEIAEQLELLNNELAEVDNDIHNLTTGVTFTARAVERANAEKAAEEASKKDVKEDTKEVKKEQKETGKPAVESVGSDMFTDEEVDELIVVLDKLEESGVFTSKDRDKIIDTIDRTGMSYQQAISYVNKESSKVSRRKPVAKEPVSKKTTDYKGVQVEEVEHLPTDKDTPVGARRLVFEDGSSVIKINKKVLKEKFEEKAWTKPVKQKDGSKAKPFKKGAFKTYEEFEAFVLEHEYQHTKQEDKQEGETIGQYEDRINNAAMLSLHPSSKQPKESQLTQQASEVQKADIERRREEEINNYYTTEEEGVMVTNPEYGPVAEQIGASWLMQKDKALALKYYEALMKLDMTHQERHDKMLAWMEKKNFNMRKPLQYIENEIDRINAKYDAEYVDAVNKGEMTKEQAMQALEEAGRKDSKAYAELKALEGTQSTEVKPGVSKLFEQNPELADEVYEAAGVKTKADVILPIGTSGSGKSTFIKSLPQENLVVIEPDAMRVEFTGNMNDKSKDKEIYEEAAKRAVAAIKQGKQVVFDTTNLTKDKRLSFIEAIKKAIPNANIQYKLMELNPELAKQRIKAQLARGENRAVVSDETIDRHSASYKQMLEDIKSEPISNFEITPQQKQEAQRAYSQYLDSLNKINTNPILQGNQKEQVKKFTELQERLNNKEFIEGAKNAYESTPALQEFGTQEQYNDYIARVSLGIIKNPSSGEYNYTSKVKDIVYHGSAQKIDKFEIRKEPLIHFGTKNAAKQINSVLHQVLLNVKDLQTIKDGMWFLGTDEGGLLKELLDRNILTIEQVRNINEAKNKALQQSPYFNENYRMALPEGEEAGNKKLQEILKDKDIGFEYINFSEDKGSTSYAVPSQEQIHILGSKQDIEGFKEFVGKPAPQSGEVEAGKKKTSKEKKTKKKIKPVSKKKPTGRKNSFKGTGKKRGLESREEATPMPIESFGQKYSYGRAGIESALKKYYQSKFPGKELRFVNRIMDNFGMRAAGYAIGTSVFVQYEKGTDGNLIGALTQKVLMHEFGHLWRDLHLESVEVKAIDSAILKSELYDKVKKTYLDQVLFDNGRVVETGANFFYDKFGRQPASIAEYNDFVKSELAAGEFIELPKEEQAIIIDESFQSLMEDPLVEKHEHLFRDNITLMDNIAKFFRKVSKHSPAMDKAQEILNITEGTKANVDIQRFMNRVVSNFNANKKMASNPRGRFSRALEYQREAFQRVRDTIQPLIPSPEDARGGGYDYIALVNAILEHVRQVVPDNEILTDGLIRNQIIKSLSPLGEYDSSIYKQLGISKGERDSYFVNSIKISEEQLEMEQNPENTLEYSEGQEEQAFPERYTALITEFLEKYSNRDNIIPKKEILTLLLHSAMKHKENFYGFYNEILHSEDPVAQSFVAFLNEKYGDETQGVLQDIHTENRYKQSQAYFTILVEEIKNEAGDIVSYKIKPTTARNVRTNEVIVSLLEDGGSALFKNKPNRDALMNAATKHHDISDEVAVNIVTDTFGFDTLQSYGIELFDENGNISSWVKDMTFTVDGDVMSLGESLRYLAETTIKDSTYKGRKTKALNFKKIFRPILQQIFDATKLNRYDATITAPDGSQMSVISKNNPIMEMAEMLQGYHLDESVHDTINRLFPTNHLIDALHNNDIDLKVMTMAGISSKRPSKSKVNFNSTNSVDLGITQLLLLVQGASDGAYLQGVGSFSDSPQSYFSMTSFLSASQIKEIRAELLEELNNRGAKYTGGEHIFPFLKETKKGVEFDLAAVTKQSDRLIQFIKDNKSLLKDNEAIKEHLPDVFKKNVSPDTKRNVKILIWNQTLNQNALQEIFVGDPRKNKNDKDFVKRAKRAGAKSVPLGADTSLDITILEDVYLLTEDINSKYPAGTTVGEATLQRLQEEERTKMGDKARNLEDISVMCTDSGAFITEESARYISERYGVIRDLSGSFKFVGTGRELENGNFFGETSYLKSNVNVLTREFVDTHPEYAHILEILEARKAAAEKHTVTEFVMPMVYFKSAAKIIPGDLPVFRRGEKIETINEELDKRYVYEGPHEGENGGVYGLSGKNIGIQLNLDMERFTSQIPEQKFGHDLVNLMSEEDKTLAHNSHDWYMKAAYQQFKIKMSKILREGNSAITVSEEVFGAGAARISRLGGLDLAAMMSIRNKSLAKKFAIFGSKLQTPGGIGVEMATIGNEWAAYTPIDDIIANASGQYKANLQKIRKKYGNITVSEISVPHTFGDKSVKSKVGDLVFGSRVPSHGKQTRSLFVVKEILEKPMGNATAFSPVVSDVWGSDNDGDQVYMNARYKGAKSGSWQDKYNKGFDLEVKFLGDPKRVEELRMHMKEFNANNESAVEISNIDKRESVASGQENHRLTLLGNVTSSQTNLGSKPLVGIVANAQRLFSYFLRYEIPLPSTITITNKNKEERSFHKFSSVFGKDSHGELKSNTIKVAEILNTALDEASHQMTGDLGYSQAVMSHAVILTYMGIPRADIVTLLKSPLYIKFSNLSQSLSPFEPTKESSMKQREIFMELYMETTSSKNWKKEASNFKNWWNRGAMSSNIEVSMDNVISGYKKRSTLDLLRALDKINSTSLSFGEYMGIHNGLDSHPLSSSKVVASPQESFSSIKADESEEVAELMEDPKVKHNLRIMDEYIRWHEQFSSVYDSAFKRVAFTLLSEANLSTDESYVKMAKLYSHYILRNNLSYLEGLDVDNSKALEARIGEIRDKYPDAKFFTQGTLFFPSKDSIIGFGLIGNREEIQDMSDIELQEIADSLSDLTREELSVIVQYEFLANRFGEDHHSFLSILPDAVLREAAEELEIHKEYPSMATVSEFMYSIINNPMLLGMFGYVAKDGKRVGEFDLNSDNIKIHSDSSITLDEEVGYEGDFILINEDKDNSGIFARLLDEEGNPTHAHGMLNALGILDEVEGEFHYVRNMRRDGLHTITPPPIPLSEAKEEPKQGRQRRGRFSRRASDKILDKFAQYENEYKLEQVEGGVVEGASSIDVNMTYGEFNTISFDEWLELDGADGAPRLSLGTITEIRKNDALKAQAMEYYREYQKVSILMRGMKEELIDTGLLLDRVEVTDSELLEMIGFIRSGDLDSAATKQMDAYITAEIARRASLDQITHIRESQEDFAIDEEGNTVVPTKDMSAVEMWLVAGNLRASNVGAQSIQRKLQEQYQVFMDELQEETDKLNKVHNALILAKNKSVNVFDKIKSKFAPEQLQDHYYGNVMYESKDGMALRPETSIRDANGETIEYYRDINGEIVKGVSELGLSKEEMAYWKLYKSTTNKTQVISQSEIRENYLPNVKMNWAEALQRRGLFGLYMLSNRGAEDAGNIKVLGINPLNNEKVLLPYNEFRKLYGFGDKKNSLGKDITDIREFRRIKSVAKAQAKKGRHQDESGNDGAYLHMDEISVDGMTGGHMFYRFAHSRSVSAKAFGTKDIHRALLEHVKSTYYVYGNAAIGGKFEGMIHLMPLVDGLIQINKSAGNDNIVNYLTKAYKEGVLLQKKQTLGAVDSWVDSFVKYTMYITLALNIPAGVFNVAIGKYNELRTRGVKNWAKGEARFWGLDKLAKGDVAGFQYAIRKNKAILKRTAFMNHSLYDIVPPTTGTTNIFGWSVDDILFSIMEGSERWIQGVAFLGEMTEKEYESYDVNGKIKTGHVGLTPVRISEINDDVRRIHGRGYSATDQRLIQQYSLGRAFLQHKRWLPTYLMERFQEEQIDAFGRMRVGSYRAGYEFARDIIAGKIKIQDAAKEMREMPKHRREAIQAHLRGIAMTSVLTTIVFSLAAAGKDDEDPLYFLVSRTLADSMLMFDTPKFGYFIMPPSLGTLKNMGELTRHLMPISSTGVGFQKMKRKGKYGNRGDWKGITPAIRLLPVNKLSRKLFDTKEYTPIEFLFE